MMADENDRPTARVEKASNATKGTAASPPPLNSYRKARASSLGPKCMIPGWHVEDKDKDTETTGSRARAHSQLWQQTQQHRRDSKGAVCALDTAPLELPLAGLT